MLFHRHRFKVIEVSYHNFVHANPYGRQLGGEITLVTSKCKICGRIEQEQLNGKVSRAVLIEDEDDVSS